MYNCVSETQDLEDGHVKFNKPVIKNDQSQVESNSTTTSFTVVMPEYTVGSKKKRVVKQTSLRTGNSTAQSMLKLSHLEDNEEDEAS